METLNPTAPTIDNKEQKEENWDLVMRPQSHLLDIDFKDLWRYRDLLYMFVKRDIVTVYKQTILGPIWFFVQPIMTTLVYIIVFGRIAGISTDGIPQPLFYLAGITLWNYFADCFNQTSDTFTQNAAIFGKVYFPRLIAPLSKVTSGLIKYLIQFSLFLAVYVFYLFQDVGIEAHLTILWVPYLVILMAGMGLGFGIIFSSMTTKYRDLKFLITFGVQLLMYATPVIYPMSTLDGKMKELIGLNPIAYIIEGFKYSFLGAGEFSLAGIGYATGFTLTLLAMGIIIFNKVEKSFMDTV
ncbi:ABC transporter permease [Persicobacter psychrovividus]|uniref:Transport permease protein n=1 Tax=Persicobacter psychrovividus TaxID=387638 RepID=A0ABM7VCW1_9BACT|nr:transport permease protein [Persicobacter psychrovividus]